MFGEIFNFQLISEKYSGTNKIMNFYKIHIKQYIRIVFAILVCPLFIHPQNEYNPIVGRWEFQSLATNYFSEPVEKKEIKKSDKYYENIVFLPSGQFSFKGKSDGNDLVGNGTYSVDGSELTTVVNRIDTFTKYSVSGNILTINKYEKESDDYYAMETVFIYKKEL